MSGFFHRLLHTPPKPVGNRTLLLLLALGMVLCGCAIGVASDFAGFMLLPFSILLGVAGGIFAYLLADRMGFSHRSTRGLLGALFAVAMYLVHHYVVYRMLLTLQPDSSGDPGFRNYL